MAPVPSRKSSRQRRFHRGRWSVPVSGKACPEDVLHPLEGMCPPFLRESFRSSSPPDPQRGREFCLFLRGPSPPRAAPSLLWLLRFLHVGAGAQRSACPSPVLPSSPGEPPPGEITLLPKGVGDSAASSQQVPCGRHGCWDRARVTASEGAPAPALTRCFLTAISRLLNVSVSRPEVNTRRGLRSLHLQPEERALL